MKFSCEKALLQAAINTASRAVSAKSSIPALEGLLLRAETDLTVSGYNMQTGIRVTTSADITQGGELVLNARLFGEIVRKLPDDVLTFTSDDKLLVHLSCGDADFDILGLSAADYPELPEVEDDYSVSLQQKALRAMIEQTAFAVSTNESRPVHTGSLFEISEAGLTIVSVDGFRLAVRREPLEKIEGGAFSFVAPGAACNEVEKICGDTEDLASITLGNRHILFEIDDTQLICRRLEGEFLDYKTAIPRNNPIVLMANTKTLISSIDRVSVVISDKLKSPVRCVFEKDRVLLSAKTGNGEAKDICPISGDGAGLEIGFNNRYLMEA
ncbi:MAG: DNA polymerase III subunit beta, partial [Oscillospiraceae bacterium]